MLLPLLILFRPKVCYVHVVIGWFKCNTAWKIPMCIVTTTLLEKPSIIKTEFENASYTCMPLLVGLNALPNGVQSI